MPENYVLHLRPKAKENAVVMHGLSAPISLILWNVK